MTPRRVVMSASVEADQELTCVVTEEAFDRLRKDAHRDQALDQPQRAPHYALANPTSLRVVLPFELPPATRGNEGS